MQLSSYENITQENIIFNEAKEYKVKDSKIKYKRIPIEVKSWAIYGCKLAFKLADVICCELITK